MRPRRDSRRPGARSASPIVARRLVGEVTFAVIGLLFLIADVRTFSSTFQQPFYGQSNTTLAIMATAVFATSFLAPLVGWRLGPKRSVGMSAAMLGIATLVATVLRSNIADLALSITGIAGGLWWLGLLHASRPADRPSPFAVAMPIAFCADLVLRAAFRTVPLVDVNPALAAPLVLVAALVGGLVLAAGLFLAAATIPGAPLKVSGSPVAVTFALALGWLVFVGTAFGFYAFWAYLPAVYAATAVVAIAAVLVSGGALPAWRALPIALVPIVVGVPVLPLLLA